MTVRLCALLWERPGRADELRAYEDAVLPLLADNRGRLMSRDTVTGRVAGDPLEIQLIEFEDEAALNQYLRDPRRVAREHDRAEAVARTQLLRLV